MAGRKPKPTALKKLESNPGKRKLNTKEPVPAKGMPECPKWLLPEAKEEWKRLCKKLSDGCADGDRHGGVRGVLPELCKMERSSGAY